MLVRLRLIVSFWKGLKGFDVRKKVLCRSKCWIPSSMKKVIDLWNVVWRHQKLNNCRGSWIKNDVLQLVSYLGMLLWCSSCNIKSKRRGDRRAWKRRNVSGRLWKMKNRSWRRWLQSLTNPWIRHLEASVRRRSARKLIAEWLAMQQQTIQRSRSRRNPSRQHHQRQMLNPKVPKNPKEANERPVVCDRHFRHHFMHKIPFAWEKKRRKDDPSEYWSGQVFFQSRSCYSTVP